MNMTDQRLEALISGQLGKPSHIKPIGNHHLKRHLVFSFVCNHIDYVIKICYKKNRFGGEVFCLTHFKDTIVQTPEIVSFGVMEDGIEWLIYKHVEGELLRDVIDELTEENKMTIYEEIGRQLAYLHHHTSFDYFGRMHGDGSYKTLETDYYTFRKKKFDELLIDLRKYEHDDPELVEKAIMVVEEEHQIIKDVTRPKLCHYDFGPRNILVRKYNDKDYQVAAIIDFEQASFGDYEWELIEQYLPLKHQSPRLAEAFHKGYESVHRIDEASLLKKERYYNLVMAISIIAWSKPVDYNYYLEGIKRLRENLSQ